MSLVLQCKPKTLKIAHVPFGVLPGWKPGGLLLSLCNAVD